ncbi:MULTISPECIES: YihY/virulence factor BrkB family protein [unclassified Rathayibacter]|uniref:YihY/virulence factor BrkB family protein n=1 Tax=unclassified Rathayibacter TaxID=2609250 RepID=UPI0021588013|nr:MULTISPECIES: YihY/virulence factor BrkB family protein [unclassified Rathayibacter]
MLALFPGLLAIVSILGLFGQAETTTSTVLDLLGGFVSADVLDTIRGPLQELTSAPAAGLAFVTGVLGALWSASGYVGASSRCLSWPRAAAAPTPTC